jgi:TPR repeat protein
LNLYIRAAESGMSQHLFRAYLCCFRGIGTERNIFLSIQYLQKSAEKNYHRAVVQYGILLLNGNFIPQNEEEAVNYFKISSSLHDGAGKFWFGLCLIEGKGIKLSYSLRFCFFEASYSSRLGIWFI